MSKLVTIINYCTNDYRFLKTCIEEALEFSDQILIPVCDHFFNGEKENSKLLHQSYMENPDATFIEYAYDAKRIYSPYVIISPQDPNWGHYWHNTSRYVGFDFIDPDVEYILFLDVDEIPDGKRVKSFLQSDGLQGLNAALLNSYFYFTSPIYRAKENVSQNTLLCKKEFLLKEALMDVEERSGTFYQISGKKIRGLNGIDDLPLLHHYSYFRKGEELKKKVTTWGHREDKNWMQLLKHEKQEDFAGEENLFGLEYERVDLQHPKILDDVDRNNSKISNYCYSNVIKTDRISFHKRHLERTFLSK